MNIEHPEQFKTGVRILMLTLRGKDGGKITRGDKVATKLISRNPAEFDACWEKLNSVRTGEERIYSTMDERDIEKAIRIFKERQLESDYFDTESRHSFYLDIFNRWISALQSPNAKKGTLFLVDVDNGVDDYNAILKECTEKGIEIIHKYETKNGHHIILKPFNPALVSFSVQKNSMILLSYNNQ